ncbi:hypothetical protein BVY04_02970 [bacterium M21]|nr:hypothetical protein BVY04_02970 [bacterium M21]
MKNYVTILIFLYATWSTPAGEFSGRLMTNGTLYPHAARYDGQEDNEISMAIQLDYHHEWDNANFSFVPFGRITNTDDNGYFADVRELNVQWVAPPWELRIGIGKVFWGATEFVHLVDIINQTDLQDSIDGEAKLGQPMVHLSYPGELGVFEVFLLPYFRERTFPGQKARLRTDPYVDTERPLYEHDRKDKHLDTTVRYSHTLGDWDFGAYYFRGTNREPALIPGINDDGDAVWTPYYEQIRQAGVDLQGVAGEWLFKLETFHRIGQDAKFMAAAGGFEYTIVRVAGTGMDLGIIMEYAYDERGESATMYDNDMMLGLRLAGNDMAGAELLLGISQDLGNSSRAVSLEASRRLNSNWKLSTELRLFHASSTEDPLYGISGDDFIKIGLTYGF